MALFKFVKLAGDVLPQFVPLIKMLSGLSTSKDAARHCFNTLKQPGIYADKYNDFHFLIDEYS